MSIIGVSGKAQSGKDTVAKIIQMMLAIQPQTNDDIIRFISNNVMYLDTASHWTIVRFADKVKDVVCLMIGCTREQLEDEVFKNTELGDEWNKYSIIKYFDGSAKEFSKLSKHDNIMIDFHQLPIQINDLIFRYKYIEKVVKLTPRMLLQQVGTNMGREVHPDVWVNSVMSEYKCKCGYKLPNLESFSHVVFEDCSDEPNWLIPDVRFKNEFDAIEARGGFIIRVNRSLAFAPNNGKGVKHNVDACNHPSETALDSHVFKHNIDNNGTIEELIEQVKRILIIEEVI